MELPKRSANQAIVAIYLLAAVSVLFLHSCSSDSPQLPLWMKGEWKTSLNGITIKEKWSHKGDSLVGITSWTKGKNKRIDRLVIRFQHDTLIYLLQMDKNPPICFQCTDLSKDTLAFLNKHNDFPKRIVYVRPTGKSMRAWVDNGVGDPNRIDYPFEKITSQ